MAGSHNAELLGLAVAAVSASMLWGSSASVQTLVVAAAGVICLGFLRMPRCTPMASKCAEQEGLIGARFFGALAVFSALFQQAAMLSYFHVLALSLGVVLISCTVNVLDIPGYPWNCLMLGALNSWCVCRLRPIDRSRHPAHKVSRGFSSVAEEQDEVGRESLAACAQEDVSLVSAEGNGEQEWEQDVGEEDEKDEDDEPEVKEKVVRKQLSAQAPDFVSRWAHRRGVEEPASKTFSIEAPEFVPRWAREEKQNVAQCGDENRPEQQVESTHLVNTGTVAGADIDTRRPWRTRVQRSMLPAMEGESCSVSSNTEKPEKLLPWRRGACNSLQVDAEDERSDSPRSTSPSPKPTCTSQSARSLATTNSGGSVSADSDTTVSEDSAEEEPAERPWRSLPHGDSVQQEALVSSAQGKVFEVSELLKWRGAVADEEVASHQIPGRLVAWVEPTTELSMLEASSPKESLPSKSQLTEGAQCFEVSENSWAAKQRARRNQRADCESVRTDEEVVRAMKSILNKLTIEKFPQLYQQMLSCGICTVGHLQKLIQEVFEKATTQHHFIDMYADLCAQLHVHFAQNPISNDSSASFKTILLNVCQASFKSHLSPSVDFTCLEPMEKREAELKYKMHMLGTIRLVGALLVRKMLASKVLLAIAQELLSEQTPEALETLAALLTVVGAEFDTPTFMHHVALKAIFCQVQSLAAKGSVPPRVRCLLRDVMDLRASGWLDKKPKKMEKPTTLEEVHQKAAKEHGSPPTKAAPEQKQKEESLDCQAIHVEVVRVFDEVSSSCDTEEALARIIDLGIPAFHQATELCGVLVQLAKEGSAKKRKAGFAVVAKLFLSGHWKPSALTKGLQCFIQDACAKLKLDVPVLPWIIRVELRPALEPLVEAGLLQVPQYQALGMSVFQELR